MQKLAVNPHVGKDLGNKAGFDLTGYRKLYVDNRRIRIVYRFEEHSVTVLVLAIGKREGLAVYEAAYKRLHEKE